MSPEASPWGPLSRDVGRGVWCDDGWRGVSQAPEGGGAPVNSQKIRTMKALRGPLYFGETATLGGAETDPRSAGGDVAKLDLNSAMLVLLPVWATG